MSYIRRLLFLAFGCLVSIFADVALGQGLGGTAPAPQDALIRAELALGPRRSATVAFSPAPVSESGGALIGSLQVDGEIRLGALTLGKKESTNSRFDLQLERGSDAWTLRVLEAESKAEMGRVALTLQPRAQSSPVLTVALVPSGDDRGRLVLWWNSHEAATDLRFLTAAETRGLQNGPPNAPVNRRNFADLSAQSRILMLSEKSLTALRFPGGGGVSLWYSRGPLPTNGPDFPQLALAADGAFIRLTQSAVPWLKTESPLRFGTSPLPSNNIMSASPSLYGLWLKRVARGWRLVLNHQAGVWGTQHDAEADALEVELTHSQDGDASRPFGAALVAAGNDRGHLYLHWGPHTWSAEFDVVRAGQ